MKIESLLRAYEYDVSNPTGLGRFEVLNMLNNRDVLEELRRQMATLQSTRLLIADEKLLANSEYIITECGGKRDFAKLRTQYPPPSSWWWFLEQVPVEHFVNAKVF
jgi:hypothetical protein